jgi:hypothetical protein
MHLKTCLDFISILIFYLYVARYKRETDKLSWKS